MTDKNLAKLPAFQSTLESLHKSKVSFEVYDRVRVEPTDERQVLLQLCIPVNIHAISVSSAE